MIIKTGQNENYGVHHRRAGPRRGQTLVEFALTLPILLLLMFGVIEFGRIFQAWVTLQNAARTAIRYAVTGQYDQKVFPHIDTQPWTPLDPSPGEAGYNDDGVPCPFSEDVTQPEFKNHWGHVCDPRSDDDKWLRQEFVRLISITEQARLGAAGLALQDPALPDIPGI